MKFCVQITVVQTPSVAPAKYVHDAKFFPSLFIIIKGSSVEDVDSPFQFFDVIVWLLFVAESIFHARINMHSRFHAAILLACLQIFNAQAQFFALTGTHTGRVNGTRPLRRNIYDLQNDAPALYVINTHSSTYLH